MLWDMEGVSGILTREHVWLWEPGVREQIAEEGRRLLMACSAAGGERAQARLSCRVRTE